MDMKIYHLGFILSLDEKVAWKEFSSGKDVKSTEGKVWFICLRINNYRMHFFYSL